MINQFLNIFRSILQEFPEADSALVKTTDSAAPVELVITPRKQAPKRDSIYSSLMERLRKTDSLLDFGEVRVQDYSTTMPSCASDSDFFAGRKLHLGKMRRGMKGTVRLQRLGSLTSTQPNDMEDETKEQGVDQLLEKLQEANIVASGKKSFTSQKQFVFAK